MAETKKARTVVVVDGETLHRLQREKFATGVSIQRIVALALKLYFAGSGAKRPKGAAK